VILALACMTAAGAPRAKAKVRKLDARELIAMRESGALVRVVDTRGGDVDYKIPGAEQVTLDALDRWAESLDRDATIVVYCT
jgi:hypothetical protein